MALVLWDDLLHLLYDCHVVVGEGEVVERLLVLQG